MLLGDGPLGVAQVGRVEGGYGFQIEMEIDDYEIVKNVLLHMA